MENINIINLDCKSTGVNILNALQTEYKEDLSAFKILYDDTALQHCDKISTLLPFRNKTIFSVVLKVDQEAKVIKIQPNFEVQTFVFEESGRPKTYWTLNTQFYSLTDVAKLHSECMAWSRLEVDYWFQWATRYFKLNQTDSLKVWDLDGKELITIDPNIFEDENFRVHLKILCQFNLVCSPIKCLASDVRQFSNAVDRFSKIHTVSQSTPLWEFFLQLLIDKESKDIVVWCNNSGMFKVLSPDKIAVLWGNLNGVQCSYSSLHNLIVKGFYIDYLTSVTGKKFTYQFTFDVSENLGMPPSLIDQLRT